MLNNVFFLPHVGVNYNGSKDVKLLILGESLYCSTQCYDCGNKRKTDCTDFTSLLVDELIRYKKGETNHQYWMNTYVKFTNVLLNKKANNSEIIDFWDSIVFYNFVQSATEAPRISPTEKQFKASELAFFEILNHYKPDIVIAWGDRLWENLPESGRVGKENILDNCRGRFYYYTVDGKEIPIFGVYHPSSSSFNFSYSKYLEEILNMVRRKKNLV